MWELVSTESDDEETPEESDNRSWCVKWSLSKRVQLSLFSAMSQEHGSKAKWLVIVIVLVVIFVLGLVLSAIVKKSSTAPRKDVEGYPTWEEIVNQVKIMMIMMMVIMMMVILMIMVCYPTWEEIVNQVRAIEANQLMSVQTIGRWALDILFVKLY